MPRGFEFPRFSFPRPHDFFVSMGPVAGTPNLTDRGNHNGFSAIARLKDGVIDRAYRLSDYANRDVPHLVILLDSIPFQPVLDRWSAGDLRWFERCVHLRPLAIVLESLPHDVT